MTGERLSWLLRALGSTGKELADAIGVDRSTLSKWRRGGRTLKYDSDYARAIAHWALTHPAEHESHVLHRMLGEHYPELDAQDTKQMENALRLWLTVPDSPAQPDNEGVFSVPLETSLGIDNVFAAQRRLFSLLRDLPDGQEIIVMDGGAVDWAHAGLLRLEDGIRVNLEALGSGRHTMRIIDQVTGTYRPWELMFQWLPMYLQPGVSTWSYSTPKPPPLRQNYIIVRGHAALVMSSTLDAPELVISSLYRAPEYVRLFSTVVGAIQRDSRPMMQTMETAQLAP